jgi:4-carboxymuconolactone decarboxylase
VAVAGGASLEDVIGTMIAVAPMVGLARLVPAANGVAMALGYDLDAALDSIDPRPSSTVRCREPHMTSAAEDLLRRLALNDEQAVGTALGTSVAAARPSHLDARTAALVRVAALVASESSLSSYQWAVDGALAAGATDDDIVDVVTTVAPVVGLARAASAAPSLALALGYDVESP